MPHETTPAVRLQRRLDRSVTLARTIQAAGCAGRISCAFMAAWGLALLCARGLAIAGGPTVPDDWAATFAAFVAAAVAWVVIRRALASWPNRLRQAVATERAHPHLGETISRAVEFIEPRPEAGQSLPSTDPTGSPALKRLAVTQAADAITGIATLPLPDAPQHLAFAAAGGLGLTALLVLATATRPASVAQAPAEPAPGATVSSAAATMEIWGQIEALRARVGAGGTSQAPQQVASAVATLADNARRVLAASSGSDGRAVLTVFAESLAPLPRMAQEDNGTAAVRGTLDRLSTLAHAAARIADAASFERRLASVLSERFQAAPGVSAFELSPPARGLLRRIAELRQECRRGIADDLQVLEESARGGGTAADQLRQACGVLARVAASDTARASEDILANRLALASRSATEAADALAAAAGILGMSGTDRAGPIMPGQREPPSSTRLAHERLDAAVALMGRAPRDDRSAATAVATATSERGLAPAAGSATGAAASPTSGTSASSTPAAPSNVATLPSGSAAFDRVWMLLPAQSLPLRPQPEDLRAFPSHRAAIDAYYRLLFESLERRRSRATRTGNERP
jgi:hypothetical protein